MFEPGDLGRPFSTFVFEVAFDVGQRERLCRGTFSECDGLEMTIEPKTIREGGSNGRQIHLMGPVSYGQLSLKRGMTNNRDLWDWFEDVQSQRFLRATCEITVVNPGRDRVECSFELTGCLPLKLRGPSLSATSEALALEEMQVAYETMIRTGAS